MKIRALYSPWWRGIVSLIALLLALEALVRLLAPQPAEIFREAVGGTVHLRPNVTFPVHGQGYHNTVSTNSLGFHDREHASQKPPGTRRVVVLGDSMVEGVHVPTSENLCTILGKSLGSSYEVLNMGVAGAGQAHEYLILQDQGRRASPDVVVLCFYYNDIYNNSFRLDNKKGKPFFTQQGGRLTLLSGGMQAVTHPLLGNPLWNLSALYRLVVKRVIMLQEKRTLVDSQSGAPKPLLAYLRQTPAAWQEAWDVTLALFQAIHAETASQRARLLIVLLPGREQVDPAFAAGQLPSDQEWDVDKPHRLLAEFCSAHHLDYIDLASPFRQAVQQGSLLYLPADEHLTAEGHALAGRLIADKLRAMGY